MSPINLVILRSLFIFFQMFVTPATAVVYSRDQLLSLRSCTQLLDTDQRSLITHLRIGRHGCRAGNHWRRRLLAARSVTSSVSCMTTCWEIPTIICHRGMFTNNNDQLFNRCRDGLISVLVHPTIINPTTTSSIPLLTSPHLVRPPSSPTGASMKALHRPTITCQIIGTTRTALELNPTNPHHPPALHHLCVLFQVYQVL